MMSWLRYQFQKLTRPQVVECDGVRLFIGDLARTSYARSLYRGSHEAEEREVIRKHLEPSDRVLEFGSGLGLVTLLCCRTVGAENVVTYEANPKMQQLLKRSFDLNDCTPDLRMKMVSVSDGNGQFFVSERFVVSSQIGHDSSAEAVTVPTDSFQTVLQEVKPTFLVMDIEGSEIDLADERIDLNCLQKLCIEVHPQITGDEAVSTLIQSLMQRGFCLKLSSSRGDVLYFERTRKTVAQSSAA